MATTVLIRQSLQKRAYQVLIWRPLELLLVHLALVELILFMVWQLAIHAQKVTIVALLLQFQKDVLQVAIQLQVRLSVLCVNKVTTAMQA